MYLATDAFEPRKAGLNPRDVKLRLARELATREGIFCGISSGAAAHAAVEVAGEMGEGGTVVTLLPDTGERYLSTTLFETL